MDSWQTFQHRRRLIERRSDTEGRAGARTEERVQASRLTGRQIRPLKRPRREAEDAETHLKPPGPRCREKLLVRPEPPVLQTDTGMRGEDPKVRGRTLVKELGKMYP